MGGYTGVMYCMAPVRGIAPGSARKPPKCSRKSSRRARPPSLCRARLWGLRGSTLSRLRPVIALRQVNTKSRSGASSALARRSASSCERVAQGSSWIQGLTKSGAVDVWLSPPQGGLGLRALHTQAYQVGEETMQSLNTQSREVARRTLGQPVAQAISDALGRSRRLRRGMACTNRAKRPPCRSNNEAEYIFEMVSRKWVPNIVASCMLAVLLPQ